jgi:hypothetical protein
MLRSFDSLITFIFFFVTHSLFSQSMEPPKMPEPRRTDRLEIFAGPGVSINHGNMFVDNYKSENVTNKRVLKLGYFAGVGLLHSLSDRIDLNLRFQYEVKRTEGRLDHALNPVNDDTRQVINSEYSYRYATISLMPKVFLDSKKSLAVGLGGYFSRIKKIKGSITWHDPRNGYDYYNFNGRVWDVVDPDGGIRSTTFIPGLQSLEKNQYGVSLSFQYDATIFKNQILSVQLLNSYGLKNIYNNDMSQNLPERNFNINLILAYGFSLKKKK